MHYIALIYCDIILYTLYSINDYSRSSKESYELVESGIIDIYCCIVYIVILLLFDVLGETNGVLSVYCNY